jgi:hypothetical protein
MDLMSRRPALVLVPHPRFLLPPDCVIRPTDPPFHPCPVLPIRTAKKHLGHSLVYICNTNFACLVPGRGIHSSCAVHTFVQTTFVQHMTNKAHHCEDGGRHGLDLPGKLQGKSHVIMRRPQCHKQLGRNTSSCTIIILGTLRPTQYFCIG